MLYLARRCRHNSEARLRNGWKLLKMHHEGLCEEKWGKFIFGRLTTSRRDSCKEQQVISAGSGRSEAVNTSAPPRECGGLNSRKLICVRLYTFW